jgi:hypothetical protein
MGRVVWLFWDAVSSSFIRSLAAAAAAVRPLNRARKYVATSSRRSNSSGKAITEQMNSIFTMVGSANVAMTGASSSTGLIAAPSRK